MRHVISISGAPEHDLDDDGWRTVVSSADAAAELAELDDLLASLGDPAAGDDELLLRLGASTKLRNSFGDSVLHQVWRFWNPKHAVQVGCVLFFQRLSSG